MKAKTKGAYFSSSIITKAINLAWYKSLMFSISK